MRERQNNETIGTIIKEKEQETFTIKGEIKDRVKKAAFTGAKTKIKAITSFNKNSKLVNA